MSNQYWIITQWHAGEAMAVQGVYYVKQAPPWTDIALLTTRSVYMGQISKLVKIGFIKCLWRFNLTWIVQGMNVIKPTRHSAPCWTMAVQQYATSTVSTPLNCQVQTSATLVSNEKPYCMEVTQSCKYQHLTQIQKLIKKSIMNYHTMTCRRGYGSSMGCATSNKHPFELT